MHLGVVLIDLRARFVLGGLGVSYFLMSDENWCFGWPMFSFISSCEVCLVKIIWTYGIQKPGTMGWHFDILGMMVAFLTLTYFRGDRGEDVVLHKNDETG